VPTGPLRRASVAPRSAAQPAGTPAEGQACFVVWRAAAVWAQWTKWRARVLRQAGCVSIAGKSARSDDRHSGAPQRTRGRLCSAQAHASALFEAW